MPVESVIDDDQVLAFTSGPAAVLVWQNKLSLDSLEATRRLFVSHFRGREMGMLIVLRAGLPPPGPREREHILANMSHFGPGLRAMVTVVEGEGFGTAAVRAVLSGLQMVLRVPFPMRTVRSLDEASVWLSGQFPGAWSTPDALACAVKLRMRTPR